MTSDHQSQSPAVARQFVEVRCSFCNAGFFYRKGGQLDSALRQQGFARIDGHVVCSATACRSIAAAESIAKLTGEK